MAKLVYTAITSLDGYGYDEALQALYQAPHELFVAERQRLARELKAANDQAAAARLAKLARPTISAWVVNQLWWHSREAFTELFATAAELRAGRLTAGGAHRKAIAKLTALAELKLKEHGHAASDATLRRVATTLAGLAATGGFEPEVPGALSKDRDPPGFEAAGIAAFGVAAASDTGDRAQTETDRRKDDKARRARDAEAAAQQRIEEARAKAELERRRGEEALSAAQAELAARELEHDEAARALTLAQRELAQAHAAVAAAVARLRALKPVL